MIVAGISLKGNITRIVTLHGNRKNHKRIAGKFHKLELTKYPPQDEVKVYVQALIAFCNDNSVDKLILNKRTIGGQGAGGNATFRAEGIILASILAEVRLVHSATILATERRVSNLKSSKPTTKELGIAYDLAFDGLP